MSPRSLLAAWLLAAAAAVTAAPADDLKALVEQGRAADAYALGKQHPNELGNPAFDFYFGIAAVDSGHAGEGVLALERYTANFPDNLTARLELGRGYFVLGDDARAREEFDTVLKANPPASVQANVQRFLDAIRSRESRYQTTAGFYVEAGIGHDSNVNGGVPGANLTLPGFGAVTLLSGVEISDPYTHLGAGGNVTHPVAPGVSLFGAANVEAKRNWHDKLYDQNNYGFAGGVSVVQQKNLWRVTGSYGVLDVDDNRFRTVSGLGGEVHHQLDELNMLNANVQYAKLDYEGANSPRNANFYSLGAGWRRAFIGSGQPLLTLSGFAAHEDNDRNRPDLGRKLYGGRIALALTPAPRWSLAFGGTAQSSTYDGRDVLLGETRKDRYHGFDASAGYSLTRNWSLRGEYQYANNDSNLALYEYKRHLVLLKVRYEYK